MTGRQRWLRELWTVRLAMLCFATIVFAGAWSPNLLSPHLWLFLVVAFVVLLLAVRRFRRPSFHQRYGPLLTSTEKARLAALTWQREVVAVLWILVGVTGVLVGRLGDLLGDLRHPLLIGLLIILAFDFAWMVKLKAAEWSVYSRIAQEA